MGFMNEYNRLVPIADKLGINISSGDVVTAGMWAVDFIEKIVERIERIEDELSKRREGR